jgi:hypothetical protein
MDAPCPHKYSRRLNKILPPHTNPYDMRIPTCCIHACVCDLSEDCGIQECAFFNLDPEMEQLAMNTLAGISAGTVNGKQHEELMWQIWEKESQKNLYAIYGNKPVCNEPLVSKEKFDYLAKKDLLDYTFNEDGSVRISINWHKATLDGFAMLYEAHKNFLDSHTDENQTPDR